MLDSYTYTFILYVHTQMPKEMAEPRRTWIYYTEV